MSGEDARARPFACLEPGCGRRFNRKFTLGEHSKTHTGERPYACPLRECGKRFSTSGNLARHKRLHKDITPFDCPVATCQRTFPTEDKLRRHVKIHSGDKVHVCGVAGCHKAFSTAGNLTRHAKLHHPEAAPRLLHSSCIASPSGVDSMDQRLGRLLLASPAPTDAMAVSRVVSAWTTAPPVGTSFARPELSASASPEPSDDADDNPLLDDPPVLDTGRYSLSVLDDVVKFELTET